MAWKFFRGFSAAKKGSGSDRPRDDENPYYAKSGVYWHWRCECGAHSRRGDQFKGDADQNAQRHQWRKGVDHPIPEVYSTNSA